MNELVEIIFLLFAMAMLIVIIVLICTHLYKIFEEPNIQKQMRRLRKPKQPWVTVIVYKQANDEGVDISLKALSKSYYHHYDIVVAKDGSLKALKAAYRKSQRGEVVITLSAGVIVPRSFLKRAVAIKALQPKVTLRVNELISSHSLSGIINTLKNLLWQRTYKVQVSNAKNIEAAKNTIQFDWLGVLILVAIIVTSFVIHETVIVWYSWLIITSYLLAVIWLNEEKLATKLQLTFSAPPALFVLPVASIVAGFSQLYSRK